MPSALNKFLAPPTFDDAMPNLERTKLAACSTCGNVKAVGPTGPSLAETCPACKAIRAFRLIGWNSDAREFVLLPDRVS